MIIAFLRLIQYSYMNHYCGYVGVKNNSILPKSYQGMTFEELENNPVEFLDDHIRVHVGISYDGVMPKETPIIPLTNIPEDWYTYHIYGFDLNHIDDRENGISTNFDYAKEQALSMKKQMEKLIQHLKNEK